MSPTREAMGRNRLDYYFDPLLVGEDDLLAPLVRC
jgi:hypothetical protein